MSFHVLPPFQNSRNTKTYSTFLREPKVVNVGQITLKNLVLLAKIYVVAVFGCKNLEISKRLPQVQLELLIFLLLSKKFLPRPIPANFNGTRVLIKL